MTFLLFIIKKKKPFICIEKWAKKPDKDISSICEDHGVSLLLCRWELVHSLALLPLSNWRTHVGVTWASLWWISAYSLSSSLPAKRTSKLMLKNITWKGGVIHFVLLGNWRVTFTHTHHLQCWLCLSLFLKHWLAHSLPFVSSALSYMNNSDDISVLLIRQCHT